MKKQYIGFQETMHGIYLDEVGEYKKFDFTITARAQLRKFIKPGDNKFMLTKLEGIVTMEDFCKDKKIRNGTLFLDFFKNHELRYKFEFDNLMNDFSYEGVKLLDIKRPVQSITTLLGKIQKMDWVMEGICKESSYFTLSYFYLTDLPKFLWSFLKNIEIK